MLSESRRAEYEADLSRYRGRLGTADPSEIVKLLIMTETLEALLQDESRSVSARF